MSSPVSVLTASDRKLRILIADDHPVIREAVRFTLAQYPRFEVCGEVKDGLEAIIAALRLKPDVVVLDVSMPILNGFGAALEIKASLPETVIVMLSSSVDHRFVEEAKRTGARAYVAKTKTAEALVEAIEAAVKGSDFVFLE
jgi:two-component system, NarL family, response regulator LiaR